MKKQIIWKVEKRKIEELKPHSKNPRIFTEKGMKDLKNSIDSIGFAQPININQDGTILSGHARLKTLELQGIKEVDVYVPDRLLTPKQEEVLVRMNANTAGQWDWDLLANNFELEEINEWGLEVPDVENMPDLSILDDNDNNDKLNKLADGVKKAIMIEFEPDHYQEAYDLIKYWREKDLYIGKYLIDKLKQEKAKI